LGNIGMGRRSVGSGAFLNGAIEVHILGLG
jgi:hypothetical protein